MVKRNKRYELPVIKQISQVDVMCSIQNITNNIIITLYGDK